MSTLHRLFPFPHLYDGRPQNGALYDWPEECNKSVEEIWSDKTQHVYSLSSSGFNYVRVDSELVCAGILLKEWETNTPARSKHLRNRRYPIFSRSLVERAVDAYRDNLDEVASDTSRARAQLLHEYVQREQFTPDFLEMLKPEIQRGLSFVHDYRQINAQISQNINYIIESKYEGEDLDERLEQATFQEKAIYQGSKLLTDKLNVSRFLLNPEWLDERSACSRFRFHGLALKYVRIYDSNFKAKDVKVRVSGTSQNEVLANSDAVSVIVHTFIDNARKYSPRHSNVVIHIQDQGESVFFSVCSFGPLIEEDELSRIFEPFYRGRHAKEVAEEGAGYGLYVTQLIAQRHLSTQAKVLQETHKRQKGCYWTEFSITIPPKADIFV